MRWRPPVLHVDYPADERDLHLGGRGLLLLPSYFCWHTPVALADPALPQILVYPLRREPPACAPDNDRSAGPLNTLLGTTRAAVLRGTAAGATTGELARIIGVSAPVISHHTAALRDAGLITSRRYSTTVLHTLTPPGAAVLRASGPASVRHP
jgi:DNA-binding transcriptional ArsR family regulator